jgi:hypothetical protein
MSRYDHEPDHETGSAIIIAQAEMHPRERLLWSGRPVAGTGWREALPMVGFGLLFAAFAAFWVTMAFGITRSGNGISESDPIGFYFPFFGVPFFLVGAGIVLKALWSVKSAAASVYALSNQRIAVISGGRSKRVRSYNLLDLGDIERIERSGGAGDLLFRKEAVGRVNHRTIFMRKGLRGVPNVRRVAEEIDQAMRDAREDARNG